MSFAFISFNLSNDILVWLSALLILAIYSFLYRDNFYYKIAEHLFVGVSAGYWFVLTYWSFIHPNVVLALLSIFDINSIHNELIRAGIIPYISIPVELPFGISKSISFGFPAVNILNLLNIIIPTTLGIMVLLKLVPKIGWVSRIPIAFMVGVTAGITIYSIGIADVIKQISSTIDPFVHLTKEGEVNWLVTISDLLVLIGVLTSLLYFYFSTEFKGGINYIVRIGIMFLMIAFGVAFGYTVMARVSLAIQIFDILINKWLGIKII
ncbi:MAG: hypothetical protein RMJ51_01945 [Candidatus Calescibacterium sp.]|nr:hypothetical protein [Candidatus Calescibacterium sp.]MCX7971910.1 hypothetical protein [bacterium]MDW8194991.1 hypothetical protein [Candidatus Calescibacterium sp.]